MNDKWKGRLKDTGTLLRVASHQVKFGVQDVANKAKESIQNTDWKEVASNTQGKIQEITSSGVKAAKSTANTAHEAIEKAHEKKKLKAEMEQRIIDNSRLCQAIIKANEEYKSLAYVSYPLTATEYFDDRAKYSRFNPEKALRDAVREHSEINIQEIRNTVYERRKMFEEYTYSLYGVNRMTIGEAENLDVDYDLVCKIENKYLKKIYSEPSSVAIVLNVYYRSPAGKSHDSKSYQITVDDIDRIFGNNQHICQSGTAFTDYKEFLNGYSSLISDMSGCYVILFFNEEPNVFYSNYKDVYVGQSVNVYQRVRNHLTGHGNGDVYAEVKFNAPKGENILIKIIPCDERDLNNKETELIAKYNATASFNKTAGGSTIRD